MICGFSENESIVGWCVSVDFKWFAYRRRENEIVTKKKKEKKKISSFCSLFSPQEFQSDSGIRFAQQCRRFADGAKVLGHYFGTEQGESVLIVVATTGVELYQFPPPPPAQRGAKVQLKLLRELKFATRDHVYSPQYGTLLLLGTGREAYHVQAIQFLGGSASRLPLFELTPSQPNDPSTCHIHVLQLYGRIYCVHADTARSRLHLLQLANDAVLRRGKVTLPLPGVGAHLHTCDNLLVVHAVAAKLCFVYDFKEHDQAFPVAPPLPLDDTNCKAPFAIYAPTWQFLTPDVVLDAANGRMWRIGVRSAAIAATKARSRPRQVDFLLRRAGAKKHLLGLLRNALAERTPLEELALVFDMFNTILGRAVAQGLYEKQSKSRRVASASVSPHASLVFNQAGSSELYKSSATLLVASEGANNGSANAPASSSPMTASAPPALAAPVRDDNSNGGSSGNIFGDDAVSLAELESRYAAMREERYLSPTEHAVLRRQIDEARRRELRKSAMINNSSVALPPVVAAESSVAATTAVAAAATTSNASPITSSGTLPAIGAVVSLVAPPPDIDDTAAMRKAEGYAILDQSDLYTHVFLPATEAGLPFKYEISVLTDYLRSLHAHHVQPAPYLYELLVNLFVKRGRFHQLHQYLQYRAIDDSVHVACQLLSLEGVYPPASQLALDMLARVATDSTREQIVDVLLAHQQVIGVLRFGAKHANLTLPVSRILEVTLEQNDMGLFFHVMRYVTSRNMLTNEHKPFVALYKQRFQLAPGESLPLSF